MATETRNMLENTYELFLEKFRDSYKAWDSFLEFLAVDHRPGLIRTMEHRFEWLFDDVSLMRGLEICYKPKLLADKHVDHLGDMYLEKIVTRSSAQKQGLFLTPMTVAEMMAQTTIGQTDEEINILDPAVGSGRLLLAASKYAPNARLFGVDLDQRGLRIAMTNFAIHNLKGYLLHADSLRYEVDIGTEAGRYNWGFSNQWNSSIDKLRPLECADSSVYSKSPQQDMFGK